MTLKPQLLNLDGLTIGFFTQGNPANPAIIALHGWLDNAGSFKLLAPYLAEDFYLIAIDFPGHGLSSHLPPCSHYHFIDGVFTIINFMDALSLSRVHLLGHSLGACLASILAGVVPDRILSMVLIEALGPFSSPEATCCQQLHTYMQHITSFNRKLKGYHSVEEAARARVKRGYLSLEHALILCERGIKEENGQFYWRHDRRLLIPSPLRLTEMQIISCLEKITTRSSLLLGDQGFNFENTELQDRVKAIPQLNVEHFHGGHHFHMEKPETVGKYLVNFYK